MTVHAKSEMVPDLFLNMVVTQELGVQFFKFMDKLSQAACRKDRSTAFVVEVVDNSRQLHIRYAL